MNPLTASGVASGARYAERWLAFRRRTMRVPGVQAAIWFDDAPVLSCAHGVADVRSQQPLTREHLFRIASHSKTFTATAVLQLFEAGRLRLDDPVSQWLPWLEGTAVAPVTLREMLAHTGGITRDGRDSDHWQLARPFPDAAELRRIAADGAAVLTPNERFKYSNIAYSLLGMVVEAASGRPYDAYVVSEIVDRLGLAHTGPELDPARLGEYAAGHSSLAYADQRVVIEHVDTAAMAAATGFYGTAEDVVRYASAHFAGDTRLLGEPAKRAMQWTVSEVGGGDGDYGLGFDITDVGGRRLLGHGGGYPGHITRTVFDPVERLAVSVFTNAIDGPALTLAHGLVRILDLACAPGERQPDAGRFTGRFANLWGVLDVVELGGQLLALDPTSDDLTEHPTRLAVERTSTLRITETGGYGAPGEVFDYAFAADGSVASLRSGGGMTFYPLEAFGAAMATRPVVDLSSGGALLPGG